MAKVNKLGNGSSKKAKKSLTSQHSITSFFKPTVKSPVSSSSTDVPVSPENANLRDDKEEEDQKEKAKGAEGGQERMQEEEDHEDDDFVPSRKKRGRKIKEIKLDETEEEDNVVPVVEPSSSKEVEIVEEVEKESNNIKMRLRVRKPTVSSPPPPPSTSDKKHLDPDAVNFLKSGIPSVTHRTRRRFNFQKGRADSASPEKVNKTSSVKSKKKKRDSSSSNSNNNNKKSKKLKNRRIIESDGDSDGMSCDDDDDDQGTTDSDVQEVEQDRNRRKRRKTNSSKKFSTPIPIIEIDEEARAFLKTGIPNAIVKVQKQIELKKEQDEYYKTTQLFPVISHVNPPEIVCSSETLTNSDTVTCNFAWEQNLNLKLQSEDEANIPSTHNFPHLPTDLNRTISAINCRETTISANKTYLCCDHIMKSNFTSALKSSVLGNPEKKKNIEEDEEEEEEEDVSDKRVPWIVKHSQLKKSLLAVDAEALEKIENWLREWKDDIRDDGGKSRKFLEKRKRRNSESDFVTSEGEDSMKTKTLLLLGPTGCGKTATVSTLANKMGFRVVEENFSTQRSGKDVLRRVEEATLSHRLESSKACLLLFKDISLIEAKEDEGFGAAVAQLITSSCRPIVMTMTTSPGSPLSVASECDTLILDVKIEKKDPLPIYFSPQPASVIVRKVLAPIVRLELFPLSNEEMPKDIKATLYSIARHCKGDIRQSINQTQLCIQNFNSRTIHNVHQYFSPFIDLNFLRKVPNYKLSRKLNNGNRTLKTPKNPSTAEIETVNIDIDFDNSRCNSENAKVMRKQALKDELTALNSLVETLEFAVALDRTNTFFERRSHHEFYSDEDNKTGRKESLKSTFPQTFSQLCALNFRNPRNINNAENGFEDKGKDSPSSKMTESSILATEDSSSSLSSCSFSSSTPSKSKFQISSLIFDNDQDWENEKKVHELHTELEEYCGTEGDLMTCGQFNYHNFAYFRTIIKIGKLNSVGASAKRNGRVNLYFNRLNPEVTQKICDTFNFSNELKIAKSSF